MSSTLQHDAWASGGAADAYYLRNKAEMHADGPTPRAIQFYASHVPRGARVLEVGAANGYQLEHLRRLTDCDGVGLEPSPLAVEDGTRAFPSLTMQTGTADALPFPDASFDAVLLGFCLCWAERRLVARIVAECDRVLSDGGAILITDFQPPFPTRRAFAHQDGLWTYKADYTALFTAHPEYVLVERIAFTHHSDRFDLDPCVRLSASVIRRQPLDAAYPISV